MLIPAVYLVMMSTLPSVSPIPAARTPLHLACRWGRVGAIRELVAAGADVEKKTGDGRTPGELLKPEMTDSERNEIVKLLGGDGTDVCDRRS